MTRSPLHTAKSYTQPAPRRCSFKSFWVGFTDWWAERCSPGGAASQKEKPTHSKGLQMALIAGLLIGAPAIAALIGPMAAGTMTAMGTQAVAVSTQVLSVVVGLCFFIGLPVWAGVRTHRFCKDMCERGQDILEGRRSRVRLL